jgi:hypothetical protein
MNAKLDIGWKQIKNMSWTVGFSLNVINNKEKMNFLPNNITGKSLVT